MATCMIPNCRKRAPSDEPFCFEHRDPPSREEDLEQLVRDAMRLEWQRVFRGEYAEHVRDEWTRWRERAARALGIPSSEVS